MEIKSTYIVINNTNVKTIWFKNQWYLSALDVVKAIINPKSVKTYWSKLKDRYSELKPHTIQIKFKSYDNKHHPMWFITMNGLNLLAYIVPIKNRKGLIELINDLRMSKDDQSKLKAYSLWNSGIYKCFDVGTISGLQQIHGYIFGGIYDFAGQIRNKNISKNGFLFSLCQHFIDILHNIDKMSQSTFDQIIEKYICMNIAHPFMEGNGRATRIWLDLILKKELNKCVDWSKISKQDYFKAMIKSHNDSSLLNKLLKQALTNKINDRETFIKGIDTSYYYEEIEQEF